MRPQTLTCQDVLTTPPISMQKPALNLKISTEYQVNSEPLLLPTTGKPQCLLEMEVIRR